MQSSSLTKSSHLCFSASLPFPGFLIPIACHPTRYPSSLITHVRTDSLLPSVYLLMPPLLWVVLWCIHSQFCLSFSSPTQPPSQCPQFCYMDSAVSGFLTYGLLHFTTVFAVVQGLYKKKSTFGATWSMKLSLNSSLAISYRRYAGKKNRNNIRWKGRLHT